MSRFFLGLFALASVAVPPAVAAPPDPREGAAIVFAPWTSEAEAIARIGDSGGAIVRTGFFPFIAVAVAEDGGTFDRAVRAAGALALLDPRVLALCSSND